MKILQYALVFLLFAIIFAISFTSSNDFSQDLGRHLKLGEIIVSTHHVPNTNLFSYTYPSFPFINHHWLSEIIFYVITLTFSLHALIILKTFLILVAVAIVFMYSLKKSSFFVTVTTSLLLAPLLLVRADIRPELFGYVFFSYVVYVLLEDHIKPIMIYSLPLIMLFWANIHITFIFGFVLMGLIVLKLVF